MSLIFIQANTHTDSKGQFILNHNSIGDTIEITHIAFNSYYIEIQKSHFAKEQVIRMKDKDFDLSEVVVKNEVQSLNVIAAISLATNPVNSLRTIAASTGFGHRATCRRRQSRTDIL